MIRPCPFLQRRIISDRSCRIHRPYKHRPCSRSVHLDLYRIIDPLLASIYITRRTQYLTSGERVLSVLSLSLRPVSYRRRWHANALSRRREFIVQESPSFRRSCSTRRDNPAAITDCVYTFVYEGGSADWRSILRFLLLISIFNLF